MSHLLLASTSDTGSGAGTLVLLGLAALALYAISCRIWPFTACSKCDGAGRFRSPNGRAWRYCRKCNGRGAQLRTGRRIWNHLNGIRDKGNR